MNIYDVGENNRNAIYKIKQMQDVLPYKQNEVRKQNSLHGYQLQS